MNGDKRDYPGSIAPPALIFFVPLVLGTVVQFVSPLRFVPRGWLPLAIGLALSAIGIILNSWSGTSICRAGTGAKWNSTTTALVMHGPFKFSRNPQYLSVIVIYVGIAVSFNAVWPLLFLPFLLVILSEGVIKPEERYLERKFGEEYLNYKARVRRWI